MLIDLLEKKIISKKNLLLENYKKLQLTENQVVIIFMIMHKSKTIKKFITPSMLSKSMNLKAEEIEKELQILSDKKLAKISGKSIDFTNLFNKLAIMVSEDLLESQSEDLLKKIKISLDFDLSKEEIEELMQMLGVNFSKQQLLKAISSSNINSYSELIQQISKIKKLESN